ncbi:hypothetical protein BH09SUM1_BH09SUM1_06390 [soil metagenome]
MFPFEFERDERRWLIGLPVAALLQAILLFIVSWKIAGGHFMFPLDDSYIHLQYARMAAKGLPLVYTPGMAPSGGMTSPLFVLLLTPFQLIGLHGVKGALASFALGTMCWMLLPIWMMQLASRLTNKTGGAIAALLTLANGHLLWNFMSGMETGLFTLLLVGAALAAQTWWQSERYHARAMLIATLALLPLARPEGAIFSIIMIALVLFRRGQQPRLSIFALLLTLAPFALWLLTLRAATGDWRPAGLRTKSLSATPYIDWTAAFAQFSESFSALFTRFYQNVIPDPRYAQFKGYAQMPYVPVAMLPLALLGAGFCVIMEWRSGRPAGGAFAALAWIGGLAAICTSLIPFAHQQRYPAPFTPLAIVLAVVALRRIAQLFQQLEKTALHAAATGLLIASAPSLGFWISEHGRNARDIYSLHRVMSFGLQNEHEPIALTDAGVLAYYTNLPAWDLVGLTSHEFVRGTLQGDGATLEALSKIPQQLRPRTLITFRSWFSEDFPIGPAESAVGIPINSIASGNVLGRFPIDWQAIDRGDAAPLLPGERLLLNLDIADIDSEAAAHHQFEIGPYDALLHTWPQPLCAPARFELPAVNAMEEGTTRTLQIRFAGPAVDGGRTMRKSSFEFEAPAAPEKNLTLMIRASRPILEASPQPAADTLAVTVTSAAGKSLAREIVELGGGGTTARDYSLGLSGEAAGKRCKISVEAADPPGAAFSIYHYWIIESATPPDH